MPHLGQRPTSLDENTGNKNAVPPADLASRLLNSAPVTLDLELMQGNPITDSHGIIGSIEASSGRSPPSLTQSSGTRSRTQPSPQTQGSRQLYANRLTLSSPPPEDELGLARGNTPQALESAFPLPGIFGSEPFSGPFDLPSDFEFDWEAELDAVGVSNEKALS